MNRAMKAAARAAALLSCALAMQAGAQDLLIRNATVHTAGAQGTLKNTDVLVRDGNIAAIGSNLQAGSATVVDTRIHGDLQLEANRQPLRAAFNRIGGNLQAVGNLGGVAIDDNTMGGNLQCKENIPAPTGRGNQAASKEDQCARL